MTVRRVYSEDGGCTLVEVLDRRTDAWGEYTKLRAIETLHESRIVKTIPDGEEFEVSRAHDGGVNCGWTLGDVLP